MAKKNTVVAHMSPDLEVLAMIYLILKHKELRINLDVYKNAGSVRLKFIPAGPLREEDWNIRGEITAERLEKELGYIFCDCGGGLLDQHGKQNLTGGSMASIDLLAHKARLFDLLPYWEPIVKVISDNDLYGHAVVEDNNMKKSATPHTARQLRNVVTGLNLLYPGEPEKVVEIMNIAFDAMDLLVREKFERRIGGVKDVVAVRKAAAAARAKLEADPKSELTERERKALELDARIAKRTKDLKIRGRFLMENLVDGVRRVTDAKRAEAFWKDVDRALDLMEIEWDHAVEDYWSDSTTLRRITLVREENGTPIVREGLICIGRSDSPRFGQVTRYGNFGEGADRRREERDKADVTIQFRSDGRFMVSTAGIPLDRVAYLVRSADYLARCDHEEVDSELAELFRKRGHVALAFGDPETGEVEEKIPVPYLAEFGTAFGNGFRANKFAGLLALSERDIVNLTMKGVSSLK